MNLSEVTAAQSPRSATQSRLATQNCRLARFSRKIDTADNISVELLWNSQLNYPIAITGSEDAMNVTFYLQT
jgi:hypothetical protein